MVQQGLLQAKPYNLKKKKNMSRPLSWYKSLAYINKKTKSIINLTNKQTGYAINAANKVERI